MKTQEIDILDIAKKISGTENLALGLSFTQGDKNVYRFNRLIDDMEELGFMVLETDGCGGYEARIDADTDKEYTVSGHLSNFTKNQILLTDEIINLLKAKAIGIYTCDEGDGEDYDALLAAKDFGDIPDTTLWEPFEDSPIENIKEYVESEFESLCSVVEKSIELYQNTTLMESLDEKKERLKREYEAVLTESVSIHQKEYLNSILTNNTIPDSIKNLIVEFGSVKAYPVTAKFLYDGCYTWANAIVFVDKNNVEQCIETSSDGIFDISKIAKQMCDEDGEYIVCDDMECLLYPMDILLEITES